MNEDFELEKIENEFISIFNAVTSNDLSIEECRKLSNELTFLNKKLENLCFELCANLKKKMNKTMAFSIISLVFALVSLLIFLLLHVNVWWFLPASVINGVNSYFQVRNIKKIEQEKEHCLEIAEKGRGMTPLIDNCYTFLHKKIDLACNAAISSQTNEQNIEKNEEIIQYMAINSLIYSSIDNFLPFVPADEKSKEIAIKILQNDLGTEETDLNKLMNMAIEKVRIDTGFTRTLRKNDKK